MTDCPSASPLPRHETAELYRLMVNGIRDVSVSLLDPHGVITVWNSAAELINGYRAADVVGCHHSAVYAQEERAAGLPERLLGQAEAHGTHAEEGWRRRQDGTPFWAHSVTTALRDDASGALAGFSVVTTDLTHHKQLEQCEKQQREIDLILHAAESGTWKWVVGSDRVEVSHHMLRMLGYSVGAPALSLDEWIGRVHDDDRDAMRASLRAVLDGHASGPIETELRMRCHDGAYRWFFLRANWIPTQPGEPRQFMGVWVEIDHLKQSEEQKAALHGQLEKARTRFSTILEQLPCGVVLANRDTGQLTYSNRAATELMATSLEQVDSFADYARYVILDVNGRRLSVEQLPLVRVCRGTASAPLSEEIIYIKPDGSAAHYAITVAPVDHPNGEAQQMVAVMQDITELKQARQWAAAEKERAHVTLTSLTEGVITLDREGRLTGMNPAARQYMGQFARLGAEEPVGRMLCDVLAFDDEQGRDQLGAAVLACACDRRVYTGMPPLALHTPDGQLRWVEHALAPVSLAEDLLGVVLVLHDVTESRRLLRRLGFEASHDSLTGLVNRREFEARLQRAIERAHQPGGAGAALLYLDLDQFKIVNDTCGHSSGDELLRQLAWLYSGHVRERDTLARIGGDEFALIVEHCDVDHAFAIAHKILDATRAFRFVCRERPFQLGVSIGLTPIDARTASVEEAMRRADHACYIAKERGRNRIHVQQRGDVELAQRRNEMHWVTRVAQALQFEQLRLYCQPIVAIGTEAPPTHFEILLRMADGSRRPVLPGSFLPAAERYDVIVKIDRWVMAHTLEWMAGHPDETGRIDTCSINLSRRSIADPSFHKFAVDLLDSSNVPASKLCFEITEHGAIADMRSTLSFINALSRRGCRFSLDDFGTGMTSFSYLKQLPVDYIKIDGSFIQTMASSQVDFEMVRFTNDISHMMGRRTIAEYVSDAKILERLQQIGVDYAQGFWVGKPRPLSL